MMVVSSISSGVILFHDSSFDSRSYDVRSWFSVLAEGVSRRVRQFFVNVVASYLFVTVRPNESTVIKNGR